MAAETVAVGPYTFPITVQLSEEGWWNDYEIYQDDAVASYTKFKLEANFIIIFNDTGSFLNYSIIWLLFVFCNSYTVESLFSRHQWNLAFCPYTGRCT